MLRGIWNWLQPLLWNLVMLTSYETMQRNGKLYNVPDILSLFCDFYFDLIFFWKTQIDCPFEIGDNPCNLILSFANLSGNSLRVYVLFGLVTWPFGSDGNGIVWCLINPLKSQDLPPPLFFGLKTLMDENFWSTPMLA